MGVLLELPDDLRAELKEPLGPIYTDADELLADAGRPLVAVGDIVTYHLLLAGVHPDVALVDGKTKRERVEQKVLDAIDGFDRHVELENPAATLTEELLETLRAVISADATTVIQIAGEEDLAALPAVLVAPEGATVVYGQPDEGMVATTVDATSKASVRELLGKFTGDVERAFAVLGVE